MNINADFGVRAVVHSEQIPWQASPMPGVDRRMLDRIGDEVARATTIVRYAPESTFSAHTHSGGEEFIVLSGTFQDEHDDYPIGSYVRNPPTSNHTPGSKEGCMIFVKLWQFNMSDRHQMHVNLHDGVFIKDPIRIGVSTMPLYQDDRESISFEDWQPGISVSMPLPYGGEILVLEGSFNESNDQLNQNS